MTIMTIMTIMTSLWLSNVKSIKGTFVGRTKVPFYWHYSNLPRMEL